MKILKLLSAVLLSITLITACGNDDIFTVHANIEGLGTQNVRIFYRDGDKVTNLQAMALDGKFSFSGVAKNPVIADIYTGSRSLLGSVVVKNGDNLEVTMKLNEPATVTIKGNRISEQLARFNNEHKEIINNRDLAAINKAVADYVRKNPGDQLSAYLMLTLFTPALDNLLADSLFKSITAREMPQRSLTEAFTSTLIVPADTLQAIERFSFYDLKADSLTTVSFPGSKSLLLALVGADTPGAPRDTVTQYFNRLEKKIGSRTDIIELSLLNDTAASRATIGEMKATYTRGWMPGALASPGLETLRPASIPWFLVTDSLGKVLYSGATFQDALDHLPQSPQ